MENFKEIINGDQPALVDFFATWCGPCKVMHPILDELKQEMGDRIRILKIDIDSPDNRRLVGFYRVQSVPTIYLFRRGKIVWKQVGAVGIDVLRQAIERNE